MIEPVAADWIRTRSGFRHAREPLASGVRRIAYLGVSVTAQATGYRPLLHQQLTRRFRMPHVGVNAGIGGVGSISCAFLMDDLVLPQEPSLCFIECTTGDMDRKTAPHDIGPALDGILHKLGRHGCDACILHLFRRDQSCAWSSAVIHEYEQVADRYGVPSINTGQYFADAFAAGRLIADELFRDVVHTTRVGAQHTADVIASGVNAILDCEATSAAPVELARPPAGAHEFRDARIVSVPDHLPAGDQCPQGRFRLTYRYVDIDSTRTLSFRAASARLKGLFVVVGPSSGAVRVSTPRGSTEYQLFDRWCRYERLSTVIFDDPIPEDTPLLIAPLPNEASACSSARVTHLKVIGLLLSGPRVSGGGMDADTPFLTVTVA